MPSKIDRYLPKEYKRLHLLPPLRNLSSAGNKVGTDEYLSTVMEFEMECEAKLIDLFLTLGIRASVKQDRYSLPFKFEIKTEVEGTSYINHMYSLRNVARIFVYELLDKNVYKIRFYLTVDAVIDNPISHNGFFGKVVYKFRYVIH
jgi:hypothetical protein